MPECVNSTISVWELMIMKSMTLVKIIEKFEALHGINKVVLQ
jgi:hypothetical protein